MSVPLQVEPQLLSALGATLHAGAAEASTRFDRHVAQLEEISGGMFTQSAAAINSTAERWRATARQLTHAVDEHGGRLHVSARLYDATEHANSVAIAGTTPIHRSTLNLNS